MPAAILLAALMALALSSGTVLAVKGTEVDRDLQARIGQISPQGVAAFEATFHNGGTSTITDLAFTFSLSGGTLASPNCPILDTGQYRCPLGSIPGKSGTSLTLIVSPSAGASSIDISDARFRADARQANSNATKVDTWPLPPEPGLTAAAAVNGEDGFYFGTWQEPHDMTIAGTVGTAARQRTQVSVPPVGDPYPFIVAQRTVSGLSCGIASEFGDEVELHAANGLRPPGGIIHLVLEYTRDAAERRTPNQVGVLHDCTPVPSCSTRPAPCFQATSTGTGNNRGIRIDVFLPSNGKVRGF